MKTALRQAGTRPDLIADLGAAAWCDRAVDAIARRGDAGCLLADPLARGPAFAGLLAWAVAGRMPARYASHVGSAPSSAPGHPA